MPRTVTLALVDSGGVALGSLPPFEVEMPWWPEAGDVVDAARERFGVSATVLRFVCSDRPAQPGGSVTYLAQVAEALPAGLAATLAPATVDLSDHPLRAPYARPGGPDTSLRWATGELSRLGHAGPVTVYQRKTWNLSGIWRLDVGAAAAPTTVWLKQLPRFLQQESSVLAWLAGAVPGAAPALLAADDEGRQLLAHLPGEDRFGAPVEDRYAMIVLLHVIQRQARHAIDDLIAAGVPDLRAGRLAERIRAVADPYGDGIAGLPALLDGLDDRLAAVHRCGLPDTLAHGDFHPGNVRNVPGGGSPPVILDWGDAVVAHPAFDILRMVGDLEPVAAEPLLDLWQERWRATAPGSDPAEALRLLRPVAPLLYAVVYANFLANIEPAEHPYHSADVPDQLAAAVEAAADRREERDEYQLQPGRAQPHTPGRVRRE